MASLRTFQTALLASALSAPLALSVASLPTSVIAQGGVATAPAALTQTSQFLLPASDRAPLVDEEVYAVAQANSTLGTIDQVLKLMRAEIFARKGMTFKDAVTQQYFQDRPWYSGARSSVQLSAQERGNVEAIDRMLAQLTQSNAITITNATEARAIAASPRSPSPQPFQPQASVTLPARAASELARQAIPAAPLPPSNFQTYLAEQQAQRDASRSVTPVPRGDVPNIEALRARAEAIEIENQAALARPTIQQDPANLQAVISNQSGLPAFAGLLVDGSASNRLMTARPITQVAQANLTPSRPGSRGSGSILATAPKLPFDATAPILDTPKIAGEATGGMASPAPALKPMPLGRTPLELLDPSAIDKRSYAAEAGLLGDTDDNADPMAASAGTQTKISNDDPVAQLAFGNTYILSTGALPKDAQDLLYPGAKPPAPQPNIVKMPPSRTAAQANVASMQPAQPMGSPMSAGMVAPTQMMSGSFILPDSDAQKLSPGTILAAVDGRSDLGNRKAVLRLARNELFARKGMQFGVKELNAYFASQGWYKPTAHKSNLNKVESANLQTIQLMEAGITERAVLNPLPETAAVPSAIPTMRVAPNADDNGVRSANVTAGVTQGLIENGIPAVVTDSMNPADYSRLQGSSQAGLPRMMRGIGAFSQGAKAIEVSSNWSAQNTQAPNAVPFGIMPQAVTPQNAQAQTQDVMNPNQMSQGFPNQGFPNQGFPNQGFPNQGFMPNMPMQMMAPSGMTFAPQMPTAAQAGSVNNPAANAQQTPSRQGNQNAQGAQDAQPGFPQMMQQMGGQFPMQPGYTQGMGMMQMGAFTMGVMPIQPMMPQTMNGQQGNQQNTLPRSASPEMLQGMAMPLSTPMPLPNAFIPMPGQMPQQMGISQPAQPIQALNQNQALNQVQQAPQVPAMNQQMSVSQPAQAVRQQPQQQVMQMQPAQPMQQPRQAIPTIQRPQGQGPRVGVLGKLGTAPLYQASAPQNGGTGFFLMPETQSRLVTKAEILKVAGAFDHLGKQQDLVRLIRAEIYARNGWSFKQGDLAAYFAQQPWYKAHDSMFMLTPVEERNFILLEQVEKDLAGL